MASNDDSEEYEGQKAKGRATRVASRSQPDEAAREPEEEGPARSPIRTPREPGDARVAEPEPPYGDLSGEPEMQVEQIATETLGVRAVHDRLDVP